MSIRALANGLTQLANPNVASVVWQQSTGTYTTNAAGKRTPVYAQSTIAAQVQAISASDRRHVDALNMQGVMRSVHMYGNPQGFVRVDQKGGDVLQFPEVPGGAVRNWQVTQVMETWADWARVIVTLQDP